MRAGINTVFIITFVLVSSCSSGESSSLIEHHNIDSEDLYFLEEVEVAASFADRFYEPVSSLVEPDMSTFGLPAEASEVFNLSSVLRRAGIDDTPENLLENGFVVFNTFYSTDNPITAYETISDWDQPVYVSSGIPLHMLHIFFDQILQNLEEKYLYEDLLIVCNNLYKRNLDRGCTLNAAFFAVPLSFLDPSFISDPLIADAVERELELIEQHLGFDDSPIFGYREDYSQYIPRGHYTASDGLERYFKAMMWLGRLTLLLNGGEPHGQMSTYIVSEDDAREMTASALLIVSDLTTIESGGELLLNRWERIYEITAFFAGFADDLSVPEYSDAARAIAGESADTDLIWSPDFYHQFRNYVNTSYANPSIYSGTGELISMPDENGEFNPDDLQEAFVKTTGFRFLGQRYTPDSEILGKLVFPAVGLNPSGRNRFMPTGLDVAAAFGSEAALSILEERGAFEYDFYGDSLASLTSMVEDYTPSDWHSTLYMSWLHCIYLLQKEKGEGYPDFMCNDAWDRHTLSNFLASWAMLRHDTILYAKQSYTMECGCAIGPDDEPVPSAGFVEPVPEVYAELRATLKMAERGLAEFGVLDDEIEMRFNNATTILKNLQNIAERELAGEQITSEDADFLKDFARRLEIAISWGGITSEGLETSLIADVHTDQNSMSVLEVASGNLDYCIVI
ncbi:MAG: DUF3160 domain-containing protein, partial [Candidatus Aegiribacteria sp.]|nr:DUF3160 domain-containing protein [Candidatus Aegiribacteria sp.]